MLNLVLLPGATFLYAAILKVLCNLYYEGKKTFPLIQGEALAWRCFIGPPVVRNWEISIISPKLGDCIHAFLFSRGEHLISFDLRDFIDI